MRPEQERHTISHTWWDRHSYDKKHAGTRYAKLVFLYPMGSVGHLLHSVASEARNVDALF
jgi:hypothetical protein